MDKNKIIAANRINLKLDYLKKHNDITQKFNQLEKKS
jgi:hypothetical protein